MWKGKKNTVQSKRSSKGHMQKDQEWRFRKNFQTRIQREHTQTGEKSNRTMAREFEQMRRHLKPVWFYREKKLLVIPLATLTFICRSSKPQVWEVPLCLKHSISGLDPIKSVLLNKINTSLCTGFNNTVHKRLTQLSIHKTSYKNLQVLQDMRQI